MKQFTRREFMKRTAVAGAGVALLTKFGVPSAQAFANSNQLSKWSQAMRLFGVDIPFVSSVPDPAFPNTDFYEVVAREYTDQLHPALNPTTLWGYWDKHGTGPQKHLGGVIVAKRGIASRIRFTNILPATSVVPVDTTVLPPGNFALNRITVHLHGGYIPWICDGGPHDWFTPKGSAGGTGLSFQNGPGSLFNNIPDSPMDAGQADYFYNNDQSTRLMWYHDHAWGITRTNAYVGLATGYLLLDPVFDALKIRKDSTSKSMVPDLGSTIPVVFQDKIFVSNTTALTDPTWTTVAPGRSLGSLWYAHIYDPKLYRMFKGQKTQPPPNPSCVPEFFGDTMLANGLIYPTLTVEAKRYRFMILNACNARFLNINLFQVPTAGEVTTDPKTGFALLGTPLGPPLIQIGNEAGYLVAERICPNGVPVNPALFTGNLLLSPAERADIIIDFTDKAGQEFVLYNDAPGPFPAGAPTNDYYLGNPKNPIQPAVGTGPDTRNILKIKVVSTTKPDPQPTGPILNPDLDPPALVQYKTTVAPIPPLTLPTGVLVRQLTLNEDFDSYGRLVQKIGTTVPQPTRVGKGYGMDYMATPTETPAQGATEVWQVFNNTADTHPLHFHLVNVQVLQRQPFVVNNGMFKLTGAARGPEPEELGWKETVRMNPGECTTVIMKFDMPKSPFAVPPSQRMATLVPPITNGNEYGWHCHILEHEEHDMMRPLVVLGSPPVDTSLAGVPYTATIASASGGTANFKVIHATGAYTVVSSDPVNFPVIMLTEGFAVSVSPGLSKGTQARFEITDSSVPTPQVATVTVSIV